MRGPWRQSGPENVSRSLREIAIGAAAPRIAIEKLMISFRFVSLVLPIFLATCSLPTVVRVRRPAIFKRGTGSHRDGGGVAFARGLGRASIGRPPIAFSTKSGGQAGKSARWVQPNSSQNSGPPTS